MKTKEQLEYVKEWKRRKRAENKAKGLRCDGVPMQPKKPRQTKAEKREYQREYMRKRSAANRAKGLLSDGSPRKRKVLTPEERKENKKRLAKETYAKRGHVYLERDKARRQADPDYNKRHSDQRKKRLADPVKRAAFNKMQREYRKSRRANDPEFKLLANMRTLMYIAVSGRGYNKKGSTMKHIGCSVVFLRKYLEDMWTEGMSWDNYGEWHVDHIKPLASFDLTDEKQLNEAWNYRNLQPLWAVDNLRKGALC